MTIKKHHVEPCQRLWRTSAAAAVQQFRRQLQISGLT